MNVGVKRQRGVLCSTIVGVVNDSPPAAKFDILTVKEAACVTSAAPL